MSFPFPPDDPNLTNTLLALLATAMYVMYGRVRRVRAHTSTDKQETTNYPTWNERRMSRDSGLNNNFWP
jgi:hypothetical protein